MLETIRNAWKIPELRKKLLMTAFIVLIFRLGNNIPVPYVDTELLSAYFTSASATILGMMNVMSGGAFGRATMLALGIQPYINSSIIIQLLTIAIPALERMAKDEGEEGRKKIAAITRYATVAIGLLQAFGYYMLCRSQGFLSDNGVWPAIVIILVFTAGSAFTMWLGEQITEFGIGNGISIILFAGIVSRIPNAVYYIYMGIRNWATGATGDNVLRIHPVGAVGILVGMLALVVFVVFITLAERRIRVQYAKRVVGRKMMGGNSTNIPMKVNMSGVLPIIFAQTIASIPATIAAFVPRWQNSAFMRAFDTTSVLYCIVYFLLIIGFSYFYATIQFNPVEVANNLKKQGGFIPGYRPGRPTVEFLSKVLSKITMFGALYLSIIAILPIVTGAIIGASYLAIGGTSVLIVVSVALETQKALEAQMMMRHYKGFLE
ncbi:MAG: preprotein translocase subunit SecY [Oscillospiraceae bacterium]|nr:preprotein translocase subunit SecY [Oscillospiraceae bacterium]